MYESIIGKIIIPENSMLGCHNANTIRSISDDDTLQVPISVGFNFDGKHPEITRIIREHSSNTEHFFTDTAYVIDKSKATCLWSRIRKDRDDWYTFISPQGLCDEGMTHLPTSESLFNILALGNENSLTPWLSYSEASRIVDDTEQDRMIEHVTYEAAYFDRLSPRLKRDLYVGSCSATVIKREPSNPILDITPMEFQGKSGCRWNTVTDKYLIPDGCDLAINEIELFEPMIDLFLMSTITDMELSARFTDLIEEDDSLFGGVGYLFDRFSEKDGDHADILYRDSRDMFHGILDCYIDAQGSTIFEYTNPLLPPNVRNNSTIAIRKTFYGLLSVVIQDAVLKTRTCYLFDLHSIILCSSSMGAWGI